MENEIPDKFLSTIFLIGANKVGQETRHTDPFVSTLSITILTNVSIVSSSYQNWLNCYVLNINVNTYTVVVHTYTIRFDKALPNLRRIACVLLIYHFVSKYLAVGSVPLSLSKILVKSPKYQQIRSERLRRRTYRQIVLPYVKMKMYYYSTERNILKSVLAKIRIIIHTLKVMM